MKKVFKRALASLLVAVMLLSVAPVTASAWWSPAKAKVYESGSCGLTAHYTCDKKTGKLIISGTGKIDDDSFARSDIRSVIIENGITEICSGAFAYCENMTSITISNSVTRIGYGAFFQCVNLKSITIPDNVTSIAEHTFMNTGYYNDETNWENDVLYIGNHLIKAKATLSGTYIIKDGTKTIADHAFLKEDVDGGYCHLTYITIPDSVTNIGRNAIYCYNKSNWENDVLYIGNHLICATSTISGAYKIKEGTKTIAASAFSHCGDLTNMTIPDSVTSIGDSAFYYCEGLTSITIPHSVSYIGYHAFYLCKSLDDIKVDKGNVVYDSRNNCNAIIETKTNTLIRGGNNTVVPDGITSISDHALHFSEGLINITIPDTVTDIGDYAFQGCSNLANVKFGSGLKNIGNCAFGTEYLEECNLTQITIPDSVINIGARAFENQTRLTSVTIGKGVKSIGSGAFSGCSWLESIKIDEENTVYNSRNNCNAIIETETNTLIHGCKNTIIPNGVTNIGSRAFSNCTGLTSITIPDSVTSIGGYAFSGCTGLTSITIGSGVTSIGGSAFSGCTGLTSITIPDSVTSIGGGAFYHTGYYKDESNWENNVLYIGKHLIDAKAAISGEYEIKKGTKTIAGYAFSDCTGLTSITILDSVTSIGEHAFYGCNGLTSITIPDSVTSIGEWAFYGCNGLTSITIPDSVTSIGEWAFSNTGYDIDKSNWENDVLYIGKHLIDAKETISGAYKIKDGTKTIADVAFSFGRSDIGYSKLTSIIIPDSVTNIGNLAFYNCESLTSITIPNSVISIGDSAFSRCSSLKNIKMSNSVTSIGDSAFYYCRKLSDVYYSGTKEEWNRISIEEDNDRLIHATIHFNYVSDIPKESILIDKGTGIKIEYNKEFDEGTQLEVKEIFWDSSFQLIENEYGKGSKMKIYDIVPTKDGKKVQPNGEVTVRIPVPTGFNSSKLSVVYVDPDSGKATKIPCEVKDGYVVFKTNHFSQYAIVEVVGGVESVSIADVTMDYKSSKTLNPEITADEGAEYTVSYSSDSKNVTVDENGKIYAAKKGTANITVTVTDSNGNTVTDTCKVTVEYSFWQWIIVIVLFGWIWY